MTEDPVGRRAHSTGHREIYVHAFHVKARRINLARGEFVRIRPFLRLFRDTPAAIEDEQLVYRGDLPNKQPGIGRGPG